ncbi:hypothetical protein X963_5664 [Burkholderia pseudomallei MSHR7498]|nr:hypothetical protein X963_5664 [Burkholderia pseudomallei MSHR7498]
MKMKNGPKQTESASRNFAIRIETAPTPQISRVESTSTMPRMKAPIPVLVSRLEFAKTVRMTVRLWSIAPSIRLAMALLLAPRLPCISSLDASSSGKWMAVLASVVSYRPPAPAIPTIA